MGETFTLPNGEVSRLSAIKYLRESGDAVAADILARSKIEFGDKGYRNRFDGKLGLVVTLRCGVRDIESLDRPSDDMFDKSNEFYHIKEAIQRTFPANMEIHDMEARAILVDRQEFEKSEFERLIDAQKDLMIAVATGGPPIATVNEDYKSRRAQIAHQLRTEGKRDPNPFDDLWAWYGRWRSGDLPRYQDRRMYVQDLYRPLLEELAGIPQVGVSDPISIPTGWTAVDRKVDRIIAELPKASAAEEFQAIGLYCRECLISLAQAVYDPSKHRSSNGVEPSEADAFRMLDAYFSEKLGGSSNEAPRRHAKSSLQLANDLQHKSTAEYIHAALCAEATRTVVNIVAIISGRH